MFRKVHLLDLVLGNLLMFILITTLLNCTVQFLVEFVDSEIFIAQFVVIKGNKTVKSLTVLQQAYMCSWWQTIIIKNCLANLNCVCADYSANI